MEIQEEADTTLYLEAFLRQIGNQIIAGLEFSEVAAWKARETWFGAMRQSWGSCLIRLDPPS